MAGVPVQDVDQDAQKQFVMRTLETRFGDRVDHDVLEAVVDADFARFEHAPIRDFVPVLVEKDVRERILRRPTFAERAEA
jgi:hypothetical protein